MKPPFDAVVDLHKLTEDERIAFQGNFVMLNRISTWVLTDDEPGKPERYQAKMKKAFPLLVVGEEIRRSFPSKGCAGFTVKPPPHN